MNQYYKVYAGDVEKNQPSIWDRSRVQKTNSKEEMDAYLKECNDVYTTFIREKIAEQDSVPKVTEMPKKSLKVIEKGDKKIQYERHHIIPRSLGGPDEEWNLVVLTYEDHFTAHKLRYEAYNQFNPDGLFLNFRTNVTGDQHEALIRAGHQTQKELGLGFFDSEAQSKRGKFGGAKQTPKKTEKYKQKLSIPVTQAFSKYMLWIYNNEDTSPQVCVFEPNEIDLVYKLFFVLDAIVPFQSRKKTSATSGLARVIKGERNHYCNWYLKLFDNEASLYAYMQENNLLDK